jgi:hypothetical protein
MESGSRNRNWIVAGIALAFGLLAAGLVAYVMRNGVGMSVDSAAYVSLAEALASGHGFVSPTGDGIYEAHFHYPPGYSLALAAGTLTPLGVMGTARLLNVVVACFSCAGLVVLTYRASGRSLVAAGIAGAIALLSMGFLTSHVMLYSDPPALAIAVAAMLVFAFADLSRMRTVLVLAVLAGLASTTRYANLALTPTLLVALILCSGDRFGWARVRRALAFLAVAALFPLAWMLWGKLSTGRLANREFGFHPPDADRWREGAVTISSFVLPYDQSRSFPAIGVGLVVIAVLLGFAAFALVLRDRTPATKTSADTTDRAAQRALLLPWLYAAGYLAFVLFTTTFVDETTGLDERILMPMHFSLIAGVVGSVALWLRHCERPRRALAGATVVAAAVVIVLQAIATWTWLGYVDDKALGFTSRFWRESKMIEFLRTLPIDQIVYTNNPTAIWLLTGHTAIRVPAVKLRDGTPTSRYQYHQTVARERLCRRPTGVVVFFDRDTKKRDTLVPPEKFIADLRLQVILRVEGEATAYRPSDAFTQQVRESPVPDDIHLPELTSPFARRLSR